MLDFYCPRSNLVIELDGGQHYTEKGKNHDVLRDRYLQSLGIKTLRFSDREVLTQIDVVLDVIYRNV